ncbi:MAG: hypothetical protein ACUZ8E_07815 [Candidatus Anammoxibacter sp.]
MTKVELTVPDKLSKINPELRDKLLLGAIREVAATQLKEKKQELEETKKLILEFEDKYQKKLKYFEEEFPKDADHKMHEDLVEWSFWNDAFMKAQDLVNDLKFVLGKTDEGDT